ncbi:phenylalanine--tRNA ligase subunit alpha [Candidatus Bathyarchaeota archaeon]|nr:phenylalanine--tRNA ligase subunit alpha [Candidatus Bathyarchaeota archaeon]
MVELREQERKTLLAIERLGGVASVEQLTKESGLSDTAIMRAALALQDKALIRIREERRSTVRLNAEGRIHAEKGLPERRLINALDRLGGKATLEKIVEKAGLEKQFIPIALGWVQRKKWAAFDAKANTLQILGSIQKKEGNDEKLLKLLSGKDQRAIEDLSSELRETVQILKGRKLLEVEEKTKRIFEITEEGWDTLRRGIKIVTEEITQLTPELVVSGKWRKVKLQKYNIKAPVAKTWPGKKHPYMRFLDEVKEKLVTLGFKEMTGPTVETSFFNFDALYMPQDHPAREIFGIYLVKSPKYGRIDANKRVLLNVKKAHENGWKTGSTGWRYDYSLKESKRLILRGHGTCQSVRTLLSKDLEIPGRYFSIVRCYRPEVVDKTHLTEFNQVEGIVVDKNLTLRDLLGVLEKFAIDIAGADEVKFKPDYFPFTEPSVELSAYRKSYGWIEFGGSGIFRPEVTLPLGIGVPVIAWGLGVDRLYMLKAEIGDIRQIFTQDLNWIRRREML